MAKIKTQARLRVRYGAHREGDVVEGNLADQLIMKRLAVDVTPRRSKGRATKNAGAAPENKGFEV